VVLKNTKLENGGNFVVSIITQAADEVFALMQLVLIICT